MEGGFDFAHKHALLDTNIVSEMSRGKRRVLSFKEVFDFLRGEEMLPLVHWATRFEFIGYSGNRSDHDRLEEFISEFECLHHHRDSEEVEQATLLSSIYKNRNRNLNPKQISFTDCLNAAQLLKYKERLTIVTTDINDYPSTIFDMPKVVQVEEADGTTLFVGFKTYNPTKWQEALEHFNSTTRPS